MARTFNPLAAYGEVFPPYRGAIRFQDGGYFNASGELVFEDHPGTPPEVVTSEVTVVDADTGETQTTVVVEEVAKVEKGDPKLILTNWLKGDVVLHHGTVRGLVKDGFGKLIATKDEIVSYLVNEAQLVPPEQVRIKAAKVG